MAFDDEDSWSAGTSDSGASAAKPRKSKGRKTAKKASSGSSNAGLSCEYLDDINQTFERFDVKKEGKFEEKQLKFAMRALGFEPKKEEIVRICEETAKDGYIGKQDFVNLMVKRLTEKNVNDEIMKAFQLFDEDKKGKITIQDLRRVAAELGEKLDDEELGEMIEVADLDGDKGVDTLEFLRIMKKTCLY